MYEKKEIDSIIRKEIKFEQNKQIKLIFTGKNFQAKSLEEFSDLSRELNKNIFTKLQILFNNFEKYDIQFDKLDEYKSLITQISEFINLLMVKFSDSSKSNSLDSLLITYKHLFFQINKYINDLLNILQQTKIQNLVKDLNSGKISFPKQMNLIKPQEHEQNLNLSFEKISEVQEIFPYPILYLGSLSSSTE